MMCLSCMTGETAADIAAKLGARLGVAASTGPLVKLTQALGLKLGSQVGIPPAYDGKAVAPDLLEMSSTGGHSLPRFMALRRQVAGRGMTKAIPLIGGVFGFAIDGNSTYRIGKVTVLALARRRHGLLSMFCSDIMMKR